ncbi:hypothetical protein D3C80_1718580 [compost metagenome]
MQILGENKDKLTALANKLLEKEVIFKEDLEEIFGKRLWNSEEEVNVAINTPPSEDSTTSFVAEDEIKNDDATDSTMINPTIEPLDNNSTKNSEE